MEPFVIEDKVIYHVGSDLDTDLMCPTRYVSSFDADEIAKHVFEDVYPDFVDKARSGGIVIAGKNFGRGSAREQAASGLRASGVKLIIAPFFSRSFYRNGINVGLPLLELEGLGDIHKLAAEGDTLRVDFTDGTIVNTISGYQIRFTPPGAFVVNIMRAGGICNFYLQTDGYRNVEGLATA